MRRSFRLLMISTAFALVTFSTALCQVAQLPETPPNTALVNGKWFNGRSFEPRTVYSVDGKFTSQKPDHIDKTLDLAGMWIVPPFGEGHNHNISDGVEGDRKAVHHYLADGVFYVKIQATSTVSPEIKASVGLNRPNGVDVMLATSALTATGGEPFKLIRDVLIPMGGFPPGTTLDSMIDHNYFVIDSEQDLDRKWPAILQNQPDFIKTFLAHSDEFEKRKNDPAFFGVRGLDPHLLPKIVEKAHAAHLRVSVHVDNSADFHNALAAGADEIAHIPLDALTPITVEDAQLAAKRGVVVDTTCGEVPALPPWFIAEIDRPQVLKTQLVNLRVLHENGVKLAIGSDNPIDSSAGEVEYLRGLKVFDDPTLLKMWSEDTPRSIFPERKVGVLQDNYEASFLALEGNPMVDWQNVTKIRLRFKQGFLIEP